MVDVSQVKLIMCILSLKIIALIYLKFEYFVYLSAYMVDN